MRVGAASRRHLPNPFDERWIAEELAAFVLRDRPSRPDRVEHPRNASLPHEEKSAALAERRRVVDVRGSNWRDVWVDASCACECLEVLSPVFFLMLRMRDFGSIDGRQGAVVLPCEGVTWMRGDRDAALSVNLGGEARRRWTRPHDIVNADGDEVIVPVRDLLTGDHEWRVRGRREPGHQQRGEELVVIRDSEHIDARARGLVAEFPRRQRSVARRSMHVKVAGEDEVLTGSYRLPLWRSIRRSADDDADDQGERRNGAEEASGHDHNAFHRLMT